MFPTESAAASPPLSSPTENTAATYCDSPPQSPVATNRCLLLVFAIYVVTIIMPSFFIKTCGNDLYERQKSSCCFLSSLSFYVVLCLFVPWYLLEKPEMEVRQIQFNFWIFFSNALCALALNFSIFLVIGRISAVTI
ncbi:putative sugar phosphate/phosphate translocator [Abeliophyllum distichum]|uniref:Sugar phosphate/phosphate translocator n=1 Tax=Abeliophyllum distichum TaxID=126358 RepID=A0ABD1PC77_9LAMI